jgi:hypothetical protein
MNKMLIVLTMLPALAKAQTGTLSGTVTSDSGQPIAAATVLYTRMLNFLPRVQGQPQYQLAPGETMVSSSAQTSAAGQFTVAGLPTGSYLVCAEASGRRFLTPVSGPCPIELMLPPEQPRLSRWL